MYGSGLELLRIRILLVFAWDIPTGKRYMSTKTHVDREKTNKQTSKHPNKQTNQKTNLPSTERTTAFYAHSCVEQKASMLILVNGNKRHRWNRSSGR